jgi:hypothetical protein
LGFDDLDLCHHRPQGTLQLNAHDQLPPKSLDTFWELVRQFTLRERLRNASHKRAHRPRCVSACLRPAAHGDQREETPQGAQLSANSQPLSCSIYSATCVRRRHQGDAANPHAPQRGTASRILQTASDDDSPHAVRHRRH